MRTKYGAGIGVELFFSFPELQDDIKSYLDTDSLAGVMALSANGEAFIGGGIPLSTNPFLVLGQPGNNRTEIVELQGATTTTITLVNNTIYPHNRGDIIRFIPYNYVYPQYSTDNGVTWTNLTPLFIRPDATETYLQRPTDPSTYLYRFRFWNSLSNEYSAYSDTVSAAGYADNTIWAVKNRALTQLGEVRGELITDQFLNDSIQEARRSLDQWPEVFRWSFRTKFGVNLGQLYSGQWRMAVPADLRDQNTNKNVLSLRMGLQNRPCVYQDRRRFNQNYLNVAHATVASTVAGGATSVTLTNSADFTQPAGQCTISGQTLTDTYYPITYTGNDMQGHLTGVTGVPTEGFAAGSDAWDRFTPGLASAFSVNEGFFEFDVPMLPLYAGQNVKIDYYSIIPPIATDDQTFDEPFYDMYVPYIKWKIKYLKANGKIDRDGDTDYKDWMDAVQKLISQEVPGQRMNFIPDIEGFLSSTE